MLLADVKIEALRMMFASYDALTVEDIADYYLDENLSPYLNAMEGSINRCIDRFRADRVIPRKTITVKSLFTRVSGFYDDDNDTMYEDAEFVTEIVGATNVIYTDENGVQYRFDGIGYEEILSFLYVDLSAITDLYKVNRVIWASAAYHTAAEYEIEGDFLIIPYLDPLPTTPNPSAGQHRIEYYVEIPVVTSATTTVDLDDSLQRLIPYFIKGELYAEEQPAQAQAAMQMFNDLLANIRNKSHGQQTQVRAIYKI